jgi:hypothetical protein
MSRDKDDNEYLTTDGTTLGVKVNIKTKILNCFAEITDTIKK